MAHTNQNASNELSVTKEEEFLINYKAVYTAMTAKPDSRSRAYDRHVLISRDDILFLNERITKKVKNQYDDVGYSISANIMLAGKERLEFPTWSMFEEYTFRTGKAIENILITWEFNLKLPKYQVPQRHTLTLKLSNGLKFEEMLGLVLTGNLEVGNDLVENECPVVVRMDFVDESIGNEFLNIVSEWVDSLKVQSDPKHKLVNWLKGHKKLLAMSINFITLLVAIWCMYRIIFNNLDAIDVELVSDISIQQLSAIVKQIFGFSIGMIFLVKNSELVANIFYKSLFPEDVKHTFDITNGDANRLNAIRKKKNRIHIVSIISVVYQVTMNLICGVLTFYLTSKL